ncbi:hypothetical protein LOZ61_003394 [Ophidiomyces ophidiicola]|nr:hypothetical protein LOZ61_003394 [Ophidiomyces ophidiicola]KAI1920543.1 hypothetical protein LOZ64_001859 [Ophidiomyces ophidiicola]KAI1924174.1 hypothetical protein LOZ60_004854 [Ophidiomyces ophidiicola]KAI2007224.1 hypothetical protein LOZ50_002699 [Ophidiomyces ophidiicola]KAI2010051.1 hypothetical protein LOZ49_003627 [Ophidiomyces ophidiicola]
MAGPEKIEEQTLSFYFKKKYYPVKIGQIFNNRYRLIAKLGYGAYSTVWLSWDGRASEYISLKVSVRVNNAETCPVFNEVNMLRRLREFEEKEEAKYGDKHIGLPYIRLANEIFETESQFGQHYCMAFKSQGSSLRTLQELIPTSRMPRSMTKCFIHRLLFVMNWLHVTCNVAHTDISAQNILMEIENDSILKDVEARAPLTNSVPITNDDGSVVYKSVPVEPRITSQPILTDFGQMRAIEEGGNNDWWMSDLYRAPEIVLGLPWGCPVDMWSIGVMTLELLEGNNIFDPVDRVHSQYVLPLALAQYIGYLGPPPLELIQQSPIFSNYFDEDGNWALSSELEIPQNSLEEFVTSIPPGEEKDQFLRFIRKMLTWDPKKRARADELAGKDDWLLSPVEWEI